MENMLASLNDAQREAVTTIEGTVRVIAGAGSGKTKALTYRFAYLVGEVGILPDNILCVTFTNKAANEMRRRIRDLTGDNDTGYINTFHGFCVTVLQEDSHAVSYPKSFLVLDNSDINDMLAMIYEERGLTMRDMTYRDARNRIEMEKLYHKTDYYLDLIALSEEELHQKYLAADQPTDIIFYGYLYQQKKCFGLDYNDLIKFVLYIFDRYPAIRLKWQERLEYVMIDEFQDIDALQYALMKVLCGYHHNLFVVGDPDQLIYSWRGADIGYILHLDKEFPDTKTIMMTENYRSAPQILRAANDLIAKNKHRFPKELLPVRPEGEAVLCHFAPTAGQEAAWIVSQIIMLHEGGTAYRDIAVLYRSHFVSRETEDALRKADIPYSLYSGTPFYEREEIKNALAYLRMIAYRDDLSFRRVVNVPKRNIGERRMRFLEQTAAERQCSLYQALCMTADEDIFKGTKAQTFIDMTEQLSACCESRLISDLLTDVLDKSGYEKALRTEGSQERLDNLAELKQSVFDYETTCGEESMLAHYLAHVALYSGSDRQEKGDRVRLMTVHAAKGLEFPVVFLCGMNEGIFPSQKTNTQERMEEERRLAFVAMTRAENRLFLTEAEGRNFDGSPRYPSRFLLDIDRSLLQFTHPPQESILKEAQAYCQRTERYWQDSSQEHLLAVGQRIRHKVLGNGTITALDRTKAAYVIRFDGMATTRTISFRIPLTPLV